MLLIETEKKQLTDFSCLCRHLVSLQVFTVYFENLLKFLSELLYANDGG